MFAGFHKQIKPVSCITYDYVKTKPAVDTGKDALST